MTATMTPLVAFHGQGELKEMFVTRAEGHAKADRILQGHGYYRNDEDGNLKMCAVGCTLEMDKHPGGIHVQYETQLGVPRILARLEDGIFENLPTARAKTWPVEFLKAIPVGADLSLVWPKFAVWLLVDPKYGVLQFAKTEDAKEAIQHVADLYQQVCTGGAGATVEDWRKARQKSAAADAYAAYAAYAAADAAYAAAAAAYAAYAADAYAAYAAYAAAAAADAAAAAADAAAADAAADAAYDAAAARQQARIAARREWRNAQADKLIELMSQAPKAQ